MEEKQCLNEQWKLRRNTVSSYYTVLLIALLICPNNGSGNCGHASIFTRDMDGRFTFPDSNTLHLWYKTETNATNIKVHVELGYKCTCGFVCLGATRTDGVHNVTSYRASNTDRFEKLTITYSGSRVRTNINGDKSPEIDRRPKYVSLESDAPVWLVKCMEHEPLNVMDTKEVSELKEGYQRLKKNYRKEEDFVATTIGLGVFGLLSMGISVAACLCLWRQYKKTTNINTTNMSQANGCKNMDAADADYITPITFTTETRNQDRENKETDNHLYESVNESPFSTRESTENSFYNQETTDKCSAPNHPTSRPNSLYESFSFNFLHNK